MRPSEPPQTLVTATRRSISSLLSYREKRRGFVGDAEGDAGAGAIFADAEDGGCVEPKARGLDLCANAKLAHTFGSERCVSGTRIDPTVDLAREVDAVIQPENSRNAVEQNVVLRKVVQRRGHYPEANIAVDVCNR